jgi:hypothetical protein
LRIYYKSSDRVQSIQWVIGIVLAFNLNVDGCQFASGGLPVRGHARFSAGRLAR